MSSISRSIFFVLLIFVSTSFAQRIEHYNSPLYSPKVYDPTQTTSNGLPKQLENVGMDQKLGDKLPGDALVKDENGNVVEFKTIFSGRPAVLALVYYECPMLCNEVLNGLTGSLKGINLVAGKDFDVIALSFDERENNKPGLAKAKKDGYLERYGKPESKDGWRFLTATQSEIDKITTAAGFRYAWDDKTQQFAHVGGIIIVSPEMTLSRYFYGVEYSPRDVKLSLQEAADNKIGTATDQLLLYCFHYDPAAGTYGFKIMTAIKIAGVFTIIGMAAMLFTLHRKGKKREAEFSA